MTITTFVKWAALGAALGATTDYILGRDDVKQMIAKKKAKFKEKKNPEGIIFEESTAQVTEEVDLPWTTETTSTYTKLSEILDSEGYSLEEPDENHIQNTYSEEELDAIYDAEAALAEEESPEEDEPTNEELEGYYDPDNDLYDTQDNYIPDEDEGELYANDSVNEIDEDEFNNSPYDTEVYYYYKDVDYFCDEDMKHLCGYREVEELFGTETFNKLKNGQPVIFLRNDFLESCYKIICVAGEYDE